MKLLPCFALLAVIGCASPAFAQQSAANFETRLSTMEDEMRAMNGQVEQLSYAIRRLDQSVQRLQGDYDQRLTTLETTVTKLSADAAMRAVQPQPNPAAPDGSLGGLKTQNDGRVTGAINAPQTPALPAAPVEALTPEEEYDHAFGLLRAANYEEAEKAFQSFIDNHPKHKLLENAKYWHAETLYVRGKFPEASRGFVDAFQQNPQGAKAPDSLLKLSMSLAAMGKINEACVSLAELKNKYANASVTVKNRAAEQRTKLKCPV